MKPTGKQMIKFLIGPWMLILCALGCGRQQNPRPPMPTNAFLVSVRACDSEDAWVVPFKVTTSISGTNVPIQEVALTHYTLSTYCQWSDCTTRTVRVEAAGYAPREYTVSGKKNIIAVLHGQN